MNELYNQLLDLTKTNEAFYHIDQTMDGVRYRIFNYRLASYSDFCLPGALECRGIMFRMDDNGPVALVARPPQKFFNYRENPFTMDVDFSGTVDIMDKADGSLISTFLHDGRIRLKTKASLYSEQAVAAQRLLNSDSELLASVSEAVVQGYTVNMEYVGPENRIVLSYEKAKLIILNIRHNETGQYITPDHFIGTSFTPSTIRTLTDRWVKRYNINDIVQKYGSVEQFVARLDEQEGIEGFVFSMKSGLFLKLKCIWYLTRHRAKDSVNSTRRLFEAVLEEAVDDIRSLFFDDPIMLARIDEVQLKTDSIYNHLVASVESFYEQNKALDRKSYAILGQEKLTDGTFGLAMSKYLGKTCDYKEYLKKNYKQYGFTDNVQTEE